MAPEKIPVSGFTAAGKPRKNHWFSTSQVKTILSLYEEGNSAKAIGKQLGIPHGSAYSVVKRYLPVTRDIKEAVVSRGRLRGPHWVGYMRKGTYIRVYCPSHPHRTREGYVVQHRLVVEEHLRKTNPDHPSMQESGYLKPDWIVHHKNGNKHDNRIENLEPMLRKEHHSFIHYHQEIHALKKRVAELEQRLSLHEQSNIANGTQN